MVRLNNVTKIYGKGGASCVALNRIDLELPDKGLVFIEGRSGSGKTTLLNIIAGFDRPTSGTVQTAYGKNHCAMIFQDFQLIDMLTVRQNLELVQYIMPQAKQDMAAWAEKYGLGELLHKYPNQISGGQKQRVAIARAVLENRPMIACDEPTGNLDEENAQMIAELLANEAKERLVLVVSHDKELFADICDRHIYIKGGEIVQDSAPQETVDKVSADGGQTRTNPVRVGARSQCLLSYRCFCKNAGKNIFLAIALFLSFTVLLSAINGLLNTEGRVIYNVHRAHGSNAEFVLQDPKYADEWFAMAEEDFSYVAEKGEAEARFVDNSFGIWNGEEMACTIERLYVAQSCAREMVCGSNSTENNKILLSDYLAERLADSLGVADVSQLLGAPIAWGCTLGGVYATKYSDNKTAAPSDEILAREYQTAYVSMQTIVSVQPDSASMCVVANGQALTPYNEIKKSSAVSNAVYGEKSELAAGEIALSVGVAQAYAADPKDLIGQTVEIAFANYRNSQSRQPYAEVTVARTVKYIVSGIDVIVLSEEDFAAIVPLRNGRFFGTNIWGVRMASCSKGATQKLIAAGYTDASYWAESIGEGIGWQRTLSFIELAVGAVLLIVCIIILCNHVAALIDKEKRALGVLVSLGIPVRRTVLLFLASVMLSVLLCLGLSAVAGFATTAGINAIMATMGMGVHTFFYEPLSVLCLFAVFVVLAALLYAIVTIKLSKKQVIDIIYER